MGVCLAFKRRQAERLCQQASRLTLEAPHQACALYVEALRLDPRHVEAYSNLGCLRWSFGQKRQAFACFVQGLRLDPGHAVLLFNLGVAQQDLGQTESAVASYQAAVLLSPKLAVGHRALAQLLERLGETQEALFHRQAYSRLMAHSRSSSPKSRLDRLKDLP